MYMLNKKKIKINGKLFAVFVYFRLDPDQARHSAGPDLRYADDIKKKKKKKKKTVCRVTSIMFIHAD